MKHIKSLVIALALGVPAGHVSAASAVDATLISNAVVSEQSDAQVYLAKSSLYKRHAYKHKHHHKKFGHSGLRHHNFSSKHHFNPKARFAKKRYYGSKIRLHKKVFIYK